jgi:hypothetical protein
MQQFSGASGIQRGIPVDFKVSGAETVSTTHGAFDTGADSGGSLYIKVNVTAASGTTPTLSVVVEGSQDGGTSWFQLGTIGSDGYGHGKGAATGAPANFTTTGSAQAIFPRPQLVRTRSVVAGTTPSFTYSVLGVIQ